MKSSLCLFLPFSPAHIPGRSSSGCEFNPRHDVNNTDMFIHGQNSLPFTLAAAFNFSQLSCPSSLPPSLRPSDSSLLWTHPSFLTVDSRASVHQPPSPPFLAACHCSPSVSIQTDGIAISAGSSPCLSLCLPHSTPSIPPSSFLSLTK